MDSRAVAATQDQKNERIERELEIARAIQHGLLPEPLPVIPSYELAVSHTPCQQVGGDYYDILSLGPQTQLLVVADMEGKGLAAALTIVQLQATLRALVTHLHSLEVMAGSLNELICSDSKSKKFLSIFLGLLDARRNGLHYINAGHVPPIVVNGETGESQFLRAGGAAIGVVSDSEFVRGFVKLNAGDLLVLSTDGINEACNLNDEAFGGKRLANCVSRNRSRSTQQMVAAVVEEIKTFSGGRTATDDTVLMVLKALQGGVDSAGVSPQQKA